MGHFRASALIIGIILWLLICIPIQVVNDKFFPTWRKTFPKFFHHILLKIMGIKVTVVGDAPQKGPALFVANHQGWLDIPVLSVSAPLSFVAKAEIDKWPVFNRLARLQRTIFISRRREKQLTAQRDSIASRLGDGDIMLIFAEGTSGRGIHVLPFRSSLFSVAEAYPDMPIYPVCVCYQRRYGLPVLRDEHPTIGWYADMSLLPHLWDFLRLGPVDVTIKIFEPLYASNQDRKVLARIAHEEIRAGLEQLRRDARQDVSTKDAA